MCVGIKEIGSLKKRYMILVIIALANVGFYLEISSVLFKNSLL